ncbi:MAG: multicopper oxidase family protein [Deltaproteobacteria bacterium]|nr:multicopper oxidase family protein [Deltaproteobacteria bacterium]
MHPLLAMLALVTMACQPRSAEPDLARELAGAYPELVTPNGTVREFEIVADETEIALIDGEPLRVWAYNGTVPGPTLRLRLGETLRVRFTNRLPQETTIHWHGVRVPNAMDGVPNATQPPIAPGESFVYEFTPKDAGTFWFHPHVRSSEQVERGLYGLLIVEDAAPPPYSRDVTWILDDWLLGRDRQISPAFNTPHDLSHDGRWGNKITVNGRTDTQLQVATGERVRLRLLNASNGRIYVPDLAGLDAKIIAVDGLYTREPLPLGRFELAPGNRLDLDILISGGGRSLVVSDVFSSRVANPLARIEIDGAPRAAATFPTPARTKVPAWNGGLSMPVTHEFRLDARRGGRLGIEWTIDGKAFAGHEHTHAHDHAGLVLERGKWARLAFVNVSARLHPIHLHGMFFKVLARDGIAVDEGFFRDTVLIHGRESIDIGVVPLDTGEWMMHCHILEHAEAGMMTMISVRDGR